MKYYKYRLVDFLRESQQDFEDTKQFYDGDSDIGVQAGKPTEKKSENTKGDYNLKQIANAVVAAIKSHTDVKAKLDSKNLQASGDINIKAGKNVSVSGKGLINMATGKAELSVPIKIKDKEVNFNIQDLDVTNFKDLYDKDIKGSFIDPESNKEITVGINIDPDSDQYSFSIGEKKDRTSFGISLDINKSNYVAGGNIGFDINDFIPNEFAPKINVGVEYDNTGGYSTNVTASKNFKTRIGKVEVDAKGKVGKTEKSAGVSFTYTPDNTIKNKKQNAAMKKIDNYFDIGDSTKIGSLKTTTVKDEEGNKKDIPKIQKDVEESKKSINQDDNQDDKKIEENKFIITKKELKILIEKLIKI